MAAPGLAHQPPVAHQPMMGVGNLPGGQPDDFDDSVSLEDRTAHLAFRILSRNQGDGVNGFRDLGDIGNGKHQYQIGVDVSGDAVKKIMWVSVQSLSVEGALQSVQAICLQHGFKSMNEAQFKSTLADIKDKSFITYTDTTDEGRDVQMFHALPGAGDFGRYSFQSPINGFKPLSFTAEAFNDIHETANKLNAALAAKTARRGRRSQQVGFSSRPMQGPASAVHFQSRPALEIPHRLEVQAAPLGQTGAMVSNQPFFEPFYDGGDGGQAPQPIMFPTNQPLMHAQGGDSMEPAAPPHLDNAGMEDDDWIEPQQPHIPNGQNDWDLFPAPTAPAAPAPAPVVVAPPPAVDPVPAPQPVIPHEQQQDFDFFPKYCWWQPTTWFQGMG